MKNYFILAASVSLILGSSSMAFAASCSCQGDANSATMYMHTDDGRTYPWQTFTANATYDALQLCYQETADWYCHR